MSQQWITLFSIARDFVAIQLNKSTFGACEYFETIIKNFKSKHAFCFCAQRKCFDNEVVFSTFCAFQFVFF